MVAISASGASEETVAALERHVGTSPTIAVTNHPERPLGHVADVALPLLAGEEVGGIACASYQCTLAVLLLLAARIAGGRARPSCPPPRPRPAAPTCGTRAPRCHARGSSCWTAAT